MPPVSLGDSITIDRDILQAGESPSNEISKKRLEGQNGPGEVLTCPRAWPVVSHDETIGVMI